MKITHPSYIGHLPIDADLRPLRLFLSISDYRLFRRGRGIRQNKSCVGKHWRGGNYTRTDFRAHLPLKIAEVQSLYLRGKGYSGSSVCLNKKLVEVCRDMVRVMGGTVNT